MKAEGEADSSAEVVKVVSSVEVMVAVLLVPSDEDDITHPLLKGIRAKE